MKIKRFEVDICQDCLDLVGEECHSPCCVFCFRSIEYIQDSLMTMNIRLDFTESGGGIYIPEHIYEYEDILE